MGNDEKRLCIEDTLRWTDLFASIFVRQSGEYKYAGDIKTLATYSEITTHGPFVVLFDRDDDREFVRVYAVKDNVLTPCGDAFDGGAYESVVTYSEDQHRLALRSVDGFHSILATDCRPVLLAASQLVTIPSGNNLLLEVREAQSRRPDVMINGSPISIDWKDGQFGAEGTGRIEVGPNNRILTDRRCDFSGFELFMGEALRGYVLAPASRSQSPPTVTCYSDDAKHSDSWASTYSWRLSLEIYR
jgi:hypothetical protein